MNRLWPLPWWLVLCIAGQWTFCPAAIGGLPPVTAPGTLISTSTNGLDGHARSPVALFRQLLAMTPQQREAFLTNRPPHIRARILAKVREYQALDPNERELRLRATELRWYLLPLMRESPTNRAAALEQVPPGLRGLVQARLNEWMILPPQLQQEFLENERAMHYFAHLDVSNYSTLHQISPPGSELARWSGMTDQQREKIAANVNQFFELTPDEKKEALSSLSDTERQQMEKTLHAFDQLPPSQRDECVHAFAKFASMSTAQKQEFLRNARRWAEMSPADRQAWRDLVTHVPQWPPLPHGFIAPPPPPPQIQPVAITNHL